MLLDKDRMAVLSGLNEGKETHQDSEIIEESVMNSSNEELERLRMIIREEVQAAFSEIRAAKDISKLDAAMKEKNVGAAMGFQGPGFGNTQSGGQKTANWGTDSPGTETSKNTADRAPVHGLLGGLGFGF